MGIQTHPLVPYTQATEILDQAAPVQNTWYTILPQQARCRIMKIGVLVNTTGETLEIRIIADGVTLPSSSIAVPADTMYYATIIVNPLCTDITVSSVASAASYIAINKLIEAAAISVEVRKITAAGAGNLKGVVLYQLLR